MGIGRLRQVLRGKFARAPLVRAWVRNAKIREQFGIELELIKGKHLATSSHPSIIHFSVNRSATQYVKSILRCCTAEAGMTHVRINDYAFQSNFPFLDQLSAREMRKYQHVFRPFGYLYSVFGGMVEAIPDFQEYLVVLVVRDPRDVLTSEYFAMAYSHYPPRGGDKFRAFMKRRCFAQRVGIDQYVIERRGEIQEVYQRYEDLLIDRPNVYVTTYEHMVSDYPTWLEALLAHCELEISSSLEQELLEEAWAVGTSEENVHTHRRQVTPGDHERKLQPETIAILNATLSDVLEAFGYV